jgi:hypothetical protein
MPNSSSTSKPAWSKNTLIYRRVASPARLIAHVSSYVFNASSKLLSRPMNDWLSTASTIALISL